MVKTKFTTTIDSSILKEIKKQAIEEDMSVGDLIEKMYNECYVRQSGKSMPKIGKTK